MPSKYLNYIQFEKYAVIIILIKLDRIECPGRVDGEDRMEEGESVRENDATSLTDDFNELFFIPKMERERQRKKN